MAVPMPLFSSALVPVDSDGTAIPLVGTDLIHVPSARISPTTTAPAAPDGAPRAPVREVGYATTDSGAANAWWAATAEEEVPELQWPACIPTYSRMRRSDPQIVSVLRAVALPVRRTRWYLDPNDAPDEVVEQVSEDMGLPIAGSDKPPTPPVRSRDRFSWAQHLVNVMEMLPFGHAFFEQLLRIDDAGFARLRKLGYRPASTLAAINVAADGGLVSIEQKPPPGWTGTDNPTIPVTRLVAYSHERVGGNWRGQSLLRPAYKPWILKDRSLRVGTGTIERNGMGMPLYTGAETDETLDVGLELARRWTSSATGGGAIPNGAKLDLVVPNGTLPDALPWVEYQDSQIARAVLAHFLNLGTQTGSWALGTTFADFFTLSLQNLAQHIADVTSQHVIEDLVDVNWGVGVRAPLLKFDEIGSRQVATAQAVKLLVDGGILTADEALESAMRSTLGLPQSGGAKLKTVPTPTEDGGDTTTTGDAT